MANPFMTGTTTQQTTQDNLPAFKEMAWDFGKNCFILNKDGSHVYVEKNEAIKVWVYHVLKCERSKYRAYFDDYGVEIEPFIGAGPNDPQYTAQLYTTVKEGLMANPYILNVAAVNATHTGKNVEMELELTTVYGPIIMNVML